MNGFSDSKNSLLLYELSSGRLNFFYREHFPKKLNFSSDSIFSNGGGIDKAENFIKQQIFENAN